MGTVLEQPPVTAPEQKDDTKPLDALVVGAGFSGVCAGIKLLEQDITNFKIVEKSDGVGGTWWDNTYPGAACDIPSHLYCFSFEQNPNWSRKFSPQSEILEYIENCAEKYGITPHIENGVKILELRLHEDRGLWEANFEGGRSVFAHHVINGTGGLHKPFTPEFPGQDSFKGPQMHTARWDHRVSMEGKKIAVIGSAASAIQVIPEAAKVAEHVTVFQRTPNYIAPRNDCEYSERTKKLFAKFPKLNQFYRWLIFMRLELMAFPITKQNSTVGKFFERMVIKHIRNTVEDPELQEKLIPDYRLGCKRVLLADNFYQSLNRDNVEVVTTGITSIEENGIRTADGALHEADVIVYATGFDLEGHMLSINIIGRDGRSLSDEWADAPEAYKGCAVAGFPNFYLVTGPNTGVGTTSVVFMIEQQMGLIMRLINKAGMDKLIDVKREAQDAYNKEIQDALANTVWASGCKSWYIREDGRNVTLYPYNARSWRKQQASVHIDKDFDVEPVKAPVEA